MQKLKLLACVLAMGAILNACSGNTGADNNTDGPSVGDINPTPQEPAPADPEGEGEIAEENPNQEDGDGNDGPVFINCAAKPWLCDGLVEAVPATPPLGLSPEIGADL